MIELNRLYRIAEFNHEWAFCFRNKFQQVSLPTEFVVSQAQFVVPKMARIYKTDIYYYKGVIYCYKDLREKIILDEGDFKGTSNHETKEIFMFEQWDDSGDDGHTDTYLVGYRFAAMPQRIPLIKLVYESYSYFEDLGKDPILHPGLANKFEE